MDSDTAWESQDKIQQAWDSCKKAQRAGSFHSLVAVDLFYSEREGADCRYYCAFNCACATTSGSSFVGSITQDPPGTPTCFNA